MNKLFTLLILLASTQVSTARQFYFDFEAEDGYELGPLAEQNSWTNFPNIPDQLAIDNNQPSVGSQHVRISRDNMAMSGEQSAALSPSFGFSDDNLSPSVYIDLYFSALNGAAYDVLAQSIFQNLITWRVRFTNTGDILIFDSPDVPMDSMIQVWIIRLAVILLCM